MKISKKSIKTIVLVIIIAIIALIGIDKATTYKGRLGANSVEVYDDYFLIEMSSGTSMGYFKEVKLKEIEEGVYSIDVYFSLLTGEYSGYKYRLDNPGKHIKELRNYDFNNPDEYVIIYKTE